MMLNKKNKKSGKLDQKTVFVGMSGGVDSSVSAALLKEEGYNVVGVFIRTWHPDFLACNEEDERRDAMRVCAHLDIPFLTFNFEDVYKKEVADYMIAEYKGGRTPNPDVMCNKHVKFGAFLEKALSMGADYVATGHYAQVCSISSHFSSLRPSPDYRGGTLGTRKIKRNTAYLGKGIDPSKDQSYFLWTLNQDRLSRILFPVGHLEKSEVRKLAKKYKLPVAEKKDSQGICFLGAVDLKDFLKHYIKEKRGDVLNEKGEKIGYHDGVVFHTLGERHGFTIVKKNPNNVPFYIIRKDVKKNLLYVSSNKNYLQKSPDIFLKKNSSRLVPPRSVASFENGFCLSLKNVNWISEIPKTDKKYTCQIRYHGEFFNCKIECSKFDFEQKGAKIIFEHAILVAPGQSIVVYDSNICLGGGIVI